MSAPISVSVRARVVAVALLALSSGCMTSPEPRVAALTDSQRGATGSAVLRDGTRRSGELLAVQDSSLLVLVDGRVAVLPFAELVAVDWGEFSSRDFTPSMGAASDMRERGRAASRFAFGLPAPALSALLARLGQTSADTVRAVRR